MKAVHFIRSAEGRKKRVPGAHSPSPALSSQFSTLPYYGLVRYGLGGDTGIDVPLVAVLGGDGFCGWPTALHLSNIGYDVVMVDNLSRRVIERELGACSLTPIAPIDIRLAAWREVSGKVIPFIKLTLGEEYEEFVSFLETYRPDAIVHFAEQRAAPYSMKSPREKRYTVRNNLNATHDVLCAIVETELDIHLVHLGTMGVYGYGAIDAKIPEGYLTVTVESRRGPQTLEILYPSRPGSVYHLTKTQDHLMFQFYSSNDELRITELHQGIVWGTQTPETALDERLINRFDYDGDYGTVLNRFLMEAAVGYPLTVYGTGGQKRAFIHIRDTVRCIELAIANPPMRRDRVEIFNQMTECHRVMDLARMISELTGAPIEFVANPRSEQAENEIEADNHRLLTLGLNPITLQDGLLIEVMDIARKYADRCDVSKIPSRSLWRTSRAKRSFENAPTAPARRNRRAKITTP